MYKVVPVYKAVSVYKIVLLLASLLCWSTVDAARNFPETALRGTITTHQYPFYRIGSKEYRIAAGGRIFNENNLIIMPVSLPPRSAEVMYRLDNRGELAAIWLLTREEAALHSKVITPGSPANSGAR